MIEVDLFTARGFHGGTIALADQSALTDFTTKFGTGSSFSVTTKIPQQVGQDKTKTKTYNLGAFGSFETVI